MHAKVLAIIGLGPRGLNVLERLIAFARHDPTLRLHIHLFDPRTPGTGVHDVDQPDHLILNTVACQVTQFSDPSVRDAGPVLAGPSFSEWMGENHQPAGPSSYCSRASFGRYLNWVFGYLTRLAPAHVRITHHRTAVSELLPTRTHRWRVVAGGAAPVDIDFVFLTLGHARRAPSAGDRSLSRQVDSARAVNPNLRLVDDPYPIRRSLAGLGPGHTVAVEGAGLTACDVLSELTIGRGGTFDRRGDRLVYTRSGAEPKVLLYSRSGLPLTARGVNEKGAYGQYPGWFLTPARVADLRQRAPGGKLDFRRDVLPLLTRDMSNAYYYARVKNRRGLIPAMLFANEFAAAPDDDARERLVADQVGPDDRFSWDRLADPIPADALRDRDAFRGWLAGFLEDDVRQARLGNVSSPVKAACDVLRDLRDTVRGVVDFGGLDEESHRWFLSAFVPVMNRLAVGPPMSRVEELMALIDAGVVRFDFGPGADSALDAGRGRFMVTSRAFGHTAEADVLVRARVAMPSPAEDRSPLMAQLLRDGVARPFMNGGFPAGGVEVDRHLNLVARDGRPHPTAWALGPLTEGCKFYTFVVPRPGVNSTALADAGRAVGRMVGRIRREAQAHTPTPCPVESGRCEPITGP